MRKPFYVSTKYQFSSFKRYEMHVGKGEQNGSVPIFLFQKYYECREGRAGF